MKQHLLNKKIAPACKYCVHGRDCPGVSETLCIKHGVVEPDHSCRSFKYDPLRRRPDVRPRPRQFSGSDFEL